MAAVYVEGGRLAELIADVYEQGVTAGDLIADIYAEPVMAGGRGALAREYRALHARHAARRRSVLMGVAS